MDLYLFVAELTHYFCIAYYSLYHLLAFGHLILDNSIEFLKYLQLEFSYENKILLDDLYIVHNCYHKHLSCLFDKVMVKVMVYWIEWFDCFDVRYIHKLFYYCLYVIVYWFDNYWFDEVWWHYLLDWYILWMLILLVRMLVVSFGS
jgi:hypothetical protein